MTNGDEIPVGPVLKLLELIVCILKKKSHFKPPPRPPPPPRGPPPKPPPLRPPPPRMPPVRPPPTPRCSSGCSGCSSQKATHQKALNFTPSTTPLDFSLAMAKRSIEESDYDATRVAITSALSHLSFMEPIFENTKYIWFKKILIYIKNTSHLQKHRSKKTVKELDKLIKLSERGINKKSKSYDSLDNAINREIKIFSKLLKQ